MSTSARPVRSPWPIAILACLAGFGIFLATFIAWALGQKQDLVAEDYYAQEVRYQEQLNRLNRTRVLGDQVTVTYDASEKRVGVTLPAAQAAQAAGRIHFYRPANARLDRSVPLRLDAAGRQWVEARSLAGGWWRIRVEWTAPGGEYYFEQPLSLD